MHLAQTSLGFATLNKCYVCQNRMMTARVAGTVALFIPLAANFLYGLAKLPFLDLSVISFEDIEIKNSKINHLAV
jgi:hypothetical protein